ncbi:MAG: hypothetical protein P1V18_05550 [Candidatus Gracilibacteria bacterium]|nr:hypothetical protein [Candidatus Gracilibacteria bacterium]
MFTLGAFAIIINSKDEVLLAQRNDTTSKRTIFQRTFHQIIVKESQIIFPKKEHK